MSGSSNTAFEAAATTCAVVQDCITTASSQSTFDQANDDHADDATWVLTSSFVILTMQSGFGLLEMGSSMPGFEVNIMTKNAMDVVFGALAYWFVGYGISYGEPSNPFCGMGEFCPDELEMQTDSGLMYSQYIFQFSFAATATTIVSGAIAMRMKFGVYCLYSVFAVIMYAFVAHWIWASSGWLNTLGVHDFAGGGPVHLVGGINGLIAVLFVGPRIGYFSKRRNRADFAPASPASTLFGLFMLWWGWIGFNCGSTFGITGDRWIVATRAAIITINASAAGGAVALFYTLGKTKGKQVRVHHLVNGILGALVATSPTCAVVHTWEALIIGAVSAILVNITNTILKARFRFDDPVGAVGVHAGGAIWGYVAVGLFADSHLPGVDIKYDGLFRGGGFKLLGLQVLAIVAITGWCIICSGLFFYLTGIAISKKWRNPRSGLRLTEDVERKGEDIVLHGIDLPYDSSIRFSSAGNSDSEEESLDLSQDQKGSGRKDFNDSHGSIDFMGASRRQLNVENGHNYESGGHHHSPRQHIPRRRGTCVMGMPVKQHSHEHDEVPENVSIWQSAHIVQQFDKAQNESNGTIGSANTPNGTKEREKHEDTADEDTPSPKTNPRPSASVGFSGVPDIDEEQQQLDSSTSKRRRMMLKKQASSRRGVGGMP